MTSTWITSNICLRLISVLESINVWCMATLTSSNLQGSNFFLNLIGWRRLWSPEYHSYVTSRHFYLHLDLLCVMAGAVVAWLWPPVLRSMSTNQIDAMLTTKLDLLSSWYNSSIMTALLCVLYTIRRVPCMTLAHYFKNYHKTFING